MDKIGVGIITCDRTDFLKTCLRHLPNADTLTVVNDGSEDVPMLEVSKMAYVQETPKPRSGVAVAKNLALKNLMQQGCDHIFLIEDDMMVVKDNVFQKYIELSKITGIKHFNFGYHGQGNKDENDKPIPKWIVEYPGTSLALNKSVPGSFSYYSRDVIEQIGMMDETFYNAWEHIEHTYRITLDGFTTPFWNFADLGNSHEYIVELERSGDIVKQSESAHKGLHWFRYKHNLRNTEENNLAIPVHVSTGSEVYEALRELHSKHSKVEMEEDQWLTIKRTLDCTPFS